MSSTGASSLDANELIATAKQITGLDRFGDCLNQDGFEVQTAAVVSDSDLTSQAEAAYREQFSALIAGDDPEQ